VTNPPPRMTCPADVSAVATGGSFATGVPAGMATASDNCPAATVGGARSDGRALAEPYPVGVTTIAWTATDSGGATASCEESVAVSYAICPLYDSTRAVRAGSTIPIKLQLCDAGGHDVSTPGIAVTAVGVARLSGNASAVLQDAGHANPDDNFRFDPQLGGYIFNLSTAGYASGTYELRFRAGSDPAVHATTFQVR
jgi:HYR domain